MLFATVYILIVHLYLYKCGLIQITGKLSGQKPYNFYQNIALQRNEQTSMHLTLVFIIDIDVIPVRLAEHM